MLRRTTVASRLFSAAASPAAPSPPAAPAAPFPISEPVSALLEGRHTVFDADLPTFLERLRERRADHCWHKHSTFKQHLHGVWQILALWGRSRDLCRTGLYHSAYSNSYVNRATTTRSACCFAGEGWAHQRMLRL